MNRETGRVSVVKLGKHVGRRGLWPVTVDELENFY